MSEEDERIRIELLISELNECREDERNTQSRILEVITLVGTILGILFGASFFNAGRLNNVIYKFAKVGNREDSFFREFICLIFDNLTYIRFVFLLSLLIFSAAFTYIITLGIQNILRNHFMKSLYDRLYYLKNKQNHPDDAERGKFLFWNEYIAPITTQNIWHVSSSHTALYTGCYFSAVGCIILFSMGMLVTLFLQIEPKKQFDYMIIIVVGVGMLLTFYLFFRLNLKSGRVSQLAWDIAHDNQKIRLEDKKESIYRQAKIFRRILKYMIYPKRKDWQKPLLIIIGFVFALFLTKQWPSVIEGITLLFFWIVFDFLAYQARYQINDIRGIAEDKEMERKNRLPFDEATSPVHAIKISKLVLALRIGVAIFLTECCWEQNKTILRFSLFILLISTILYEFCRKRNRKTLVYILVGIGYPLRFFVGFMAITWSGKSYMECASELLIILTALWAYGSMSAILAWTNEISDFISKRRESNESFPESYKKKHYEDIQLKIKERYLRAEGFSINSKILPLREKGCFRDYWNTCFIISLLPTILLITDCSGKSIVAFLSLIAIGLYFVSFYCARKRKCICIILGMIFQIAIVIWIVWSHKTTLIYVLPYLLLQLLIGITYFVLLYRPQMGEVSFWGIMKKLMKKGNRVLFGAEAARIIEEERQNRD